MEPSTGRLSMQTIRLSHGNDYQVVKLRCPSLIRSPLDHRRLSVLPVSVPSAHSALKSQHFSALVVFRVHDMEAGRMTGRQQLRIGADDGQPQGFEFQCQRQMQYLWCPEGRILQREFFRG